MGAGTLTMPYIISKTGTILGPVLIYSGGLLSCYAAMLIIKCNLMTGKTTYEELAYVGFGSYASNIVSVVILIALISFAIAYVALAKTLIPSTIENVLGKSNTPLFL